MDPLAELLRSAPAILFDFDGVIVDSEPLHYESYRIVFAGLGHSVDRAEYWRHWTDLGEGPEGEIRRHGLSGVTPEGIIEAKKPVYDRFIGEGRMRLFPGAANLLSALAASGLPAAIASNSANETIEAILAAAGLARSPIPVVGRRPGLRPKPFPDVFLEAARVLGVRAQGCVVVEDARKGVEAAVAASMAVVLFRNELNCGFDYPEAAAEVRSLDELERALAASGR